MKLPEGFYFEAEEQMEREPPLKIRISVYRPNGFLYATRLLDYPENYSPEWLARKAKELYTEEYHRNNP